MLYKADTVLTDLEFYTQHLDTSVKGLEGIDKLAKNGDFAAADHQFAEFVKSYLHPEKYVRYGTFGDMDNIFTLEGETCIDVAKRYMNSDVISVGIRHKFDGEIMWQENPTPDGYAEWTWQLSRHHEMFCLLDAYHDTRDEKYADAFLRIFMGFINQAPFPGYVGSGDTKCWRTIEVGIRMSGVWNSAIMTFMYSPLCTDRDIVVMFKSVWENGARLFAAPSGGNWLFMEMNGLANVGLLYKFFIESDKWFKFAVKTISAQAHEQVYDDGFHFELTTNYHQVIIGNLLGIISLCKRMDEPVPQTLVDACEKTFGLYPKLADPSLHIPDLNDGRPSYLPDLMDATESLFPDREDFTYIRTARREGKPPLFKSICLPYAGMSIMRTGWNSDDIWCFFDGGPFGSGHQHEDKLQMLLSAYGQNFLVEAGRHGYDGSAFHVYSLLSYAHNTVTVDGKSQNRRENYCWRGEMLKQHSGIIFNTNENYDSTEATYNEPYDNGLTDVTHNRRIIFIKTGSIAPAIVVIDRMTAGSEHTYEAIWHYADLSVEKKAENRVDCVTKNGTSLFCFTGNYDDITIVKGQTEPSIQGFLVTERVDQHTPVPTALMKKKAVNVRTAAVFVPRRKNDCNITGITLSDDVNETEFTIHTDSGDIKLNEIRFF